MNIAVDVKPATPVVGATLASCMTSLMHCLGEPEWSIAGMQGAMGHLFQFAMKEGGGSVMHDSMDWGIALDIVPEMAAFERFKATKDTTGVDLPALKREAKDAVRASLGRGVPGLVWQPMTEDMKTRGQYAFCWGLIVGYNEPDETFTLRHPFVADTYAIRYDAIGLSDGAQKFEVMVFEEAVSEGDETRHVRALQNGVRLAHGVRYSDRQFIKDNGEPTNPYGFAAYELWRKAFDSEDLPLETSRYHSEILRDRRQLAASYMRELATRFSEAAEVLAAAATHYDREVEFLIPLNELCTAARDNETITAEERAEAGRLIGEALKEEKKAIARIAAALEILDAS